jgi:hypothetical protein
MIYNNPTEIFSLSSTCKTAHEVVFIMQGSRHKIEPQRPNFKTFKESILPAYVARRAGTITLFLLGSLGPIDCLKIPAQDAHFIHRSH